MVYHLLLALKTTSQMVISVAETLTCTKQSCLLGQFEALQVGQTKTAFGPPPQVLVESEPGAPLPYGSPGLHQLFWYNQ